MDSNGGRMAHERVGDESSMASNVVFPHNIAVLLRMDNQAAIAHVNKMDGPMLSPLSQMAQQLSGWCLTSKLSLHAEHLPGKENALADWESRHTHDSSDW